MMGSKICTSTTENIAATERADIRAFVPLSAAGKARLFLSKEEFAYDPSMTSTGVRQARSSHPRPSEPPETSSSTRPSRVGAPPAR
jgi:hypothetical protein